MRTRTLSPVSSLSATLAALTRADLLSRKTMILLSMTKRRISKLFKPNLLRRKELVLVTRIRLMLLRVPRMLAKASKPVSRSLGQTTRFRNSFTRAVRLDANLTIVSNLRGAEEGTTKVVVLWADVHLSTQLTTTHQCEVPTSQAKTTI